MYFRLLNSYYLSSFFILMFNFLYIICEKWFKFFLILLLKDFFSNGHEKVYIFLSNIQKHKISISIKTN